jgi:hypothetical protein
MSGASGDTIVMCCVVLAAWIAVLALTLPRYYRSGGWRGAWLGFDGALLVAVGGGPGSDIRDLFRESAEFAGDPCDLQVDEPSGRPGPGTAGRRER